MCHHRDQQHGFNCSVLASFSCFFEDIGVTFPVKHDFYAPTFGVMFTIVYFICIQIVDTVNKSSKSSTKCPTSERPSDKINVDG